MSAGPGFKLKSPGTRPETRAQCHYRGNPNGSGADPFEEPPPADRSSNLKSAFFFLLFGTCGPACQPPSRL